MVLDSIVNTGNNKEMCYLSIPGVKKHIGTGIYFIINGLCTYLCSENNLASSLLHNVGQMLHINIIVQQILD